MNTQQAISTLGQPCNATVLLQVARALGVRGELVKRMRSGKELRAYALPGSWANTRILAKAEQHVI